MTVYLVVNDSYENYSVERVYADRDEAEAFAAAYNAAKGYTAVDVEAREVGGPNVAYDGPVWSITWTTWRKLADGFTTTLVEGPPWRVLAAPEYEEPPIWIDRFSSRQDWTSGDHPGEAKITARNRHEVTARGTSKEACESLVRANAIDVKAELGIG